VHTKVVRKFVILGTNLGRSPESGSGLIIGPIQEMYGYQHERVEKEFNSGMAKFEANRKNNAVSTR